MKRLNWVDIVIIVILVGALAFVGIRAIAKNIEENKIRAASFVKLPCSKPMKERQESYQVMVNICFLNHMPFW